jgi:hypothetical protein
VDVYSVALASFLLAVLSLVPDIIPVDLRWAVLLAGVGLLVLRIAIPDTSEYTVDELLNDRSAFTNRPIADRLKNAREVCIFAPTAINLLSATTASLRTGVLSQPDGKVRVVVLDPANHEAIKLAARQLDESVDYSIQDVDATLRAAIRQLSSMSSWPVRGTFQYRYLSYNPGFSLFIIDPHSRNGTAIIEFHGFHNLDTDSRMHIELLRKNSDRWFTYWTDQFNRIWDLSATPPSGPAPSTSSGV